MMPDPGLRPDEAVARHRHPLRQTRRNHRAGIVLAAIVLVWLR